MKLKRIIGILIGVSLVYFALQKLQDPAGFLKSVHTYDILPEQPPWALNLAAIMIPWIELVAGLSILSNKWTRPAASLSGLMLLCFTAAVLARGLSIHEGGDLSFCEIAFDCGCGTGVVNLCVKLIENTLLIAGCGYLSITSKQGED